METFTVYLDEKVTVWSRQKFYIDAETKEQALALAKRQVDEDGPDDFEYLSDSEEELSPKDNGGQYTKEWIIDDEQVETNGSPFYDIETHVWI